jgi:RNA recognition motif-containing protein
LSLTDPDSFARFLLLPADTLQNVILQLANNNKQALVAHNIRVREIWVGNLPSEINDRSLKAIFERFGPIENVEMFQKNSLTFAFIRFERVSQATKAFENQDELGLELRAALKISFADFLKRSNIVGDSIEVEDVSCSCSYHRTRKILLRSWSFATHMAITYQKRL